MKIFTDEELLAILREMVRKTSQKEVADQLGVGKAFINDVVHGRRNMTARLAEAMGYQQQVIYRKVA